MSTGDPILDNAIGGAAVAVAVGLYRMTPAERLIKRVFGRDATATKIAENNTLEFLSRLSVRVEKLEGENAKDSTAADRIKAALSDPDVAFSFREAILSSARTGSKRRHELLAQAVAERLNAKPDSAKAVASNQALK